MDKYALVAMRAGLIGHAGADMAWRLRDVETARLKAGKKCTDDYLLQQCRAMVADDKNTAELIEAFRKQHGAYD